jgi:hypothetical protein
MSCDPFQRCQAAEPIAPSVLGTRITLRSRSVTMNSARSDPGFLCVPRKRIASLFGDHATGMARLRFTNSRRYLPAGVITSSEVSEFLAVDSCEQTAIHLPLGDQTGHARSKERGTLCVRRVSTFVIVMPASTVEEATRRPSGAQLNWMAFLVTEAIVLRATRSSQSWYCSSRNHVKASCRPSPGRRRTAVRAGPIQSAIRQRANTLPTLHSST